ncbi:ASCH domain-containing protein [Actinomyces vulturis]|uniref:ASCH domain-containing protein n=1 Tax=Actinomyces vulturis TaxID=1857645 RepID=UPI00082A35DA|nr:ASCH domain-containing protein [Actinomyces vulturis]
MLELHELPPHLQDLPVGLYKFPGPERDALVAAIDDGRKTTTSSLLIEYIVHDLPIPAAGDREVVIDSAERAICLTRATYVEVCRLADVELRHVLGEGTGRKSVEEWRTAQEIFWRSARFERVLKDFGVTNFTLSDDSLVVWVTMEVTEHF